MSQCDKCYHRALCKIRDGYGEPKDHECLSFQDVAQILPMIVPLGSNLWVIEDNQVWKGTLEKVSISKTNGIWLEVIMPREMQDIESIEYQPSDFGQRIFKREELARNALCSRKQESEGL
jgi:hypothetical protein